MKRGDYFAKMQAMIDVNISCSISTPTTDNMLKYLKAIHYFLYRNFKNHKKYQKILLTSNQPARLCGTTKTHKFDASGKITKDQLKLRPIILQTGIYTYNEAQVIAE